MQRYWIFPLIILAFKGFLEGASTGVAWITSKPVVFPVFHHVQLQQVPALAEVVAQRTISSLSLRREDSLEVLKIMCERKEARQLPGLLGASTISSPDQINKVASYGVDFLSTTFTSEDILVRAAERFLPVLSGVQSLADCQNAIRYGASALKFYPISKIGLQELRGVRKEAQTSLPVCVSGGLELSDLPLYLAEGATIFALGFKMDEISVEEVVKKLREADQALAKAQQNMMAYAF